MTIYDPSTLRLEVSVSEYLREKLPLGAPVKASIDPIGAEFESKVVEIVPASDASSRSFTVRASIPDAGIAYPGMYARIRLPIETRQIILVPADAVQRVGQLDMVTVVENGVARTRSVKLGKTYPEGVEVLAGLTEGDVIAFP